MLQQLAEVGQQADGNGKQRHGYQGVFVSAMHQQDEIPQETLYVHHDLKHQCNRQETDDTDQHIVDNCFQRVFHVCFLWSCREI